MRGLWRRRKKGTALSAYYKNIKTAPALGRKKYRWRKLVIQASVCVVIGFLALSISDSNNSVGKKMEGYVKYLMTKEVNFRPVFQQVVDVTAKVRNFDAPFLDENYTPPKVVVTTKSQEMMALPVSGKITRPYGWVQSELDGASRFHEGVDIAAPAGKGIKAALAGKVVKVGEDRVLGKYIILNHNQNLKTLYAHISGEKVKTGDVIKEGQVLGIVSSDEDSDTTGLHFEVREKGKLTDPMLKLKADNSE